MSMNRNKKKREKLHVHVSFEIRFCQRFSDMSYFTVNLISNKLHKTRFRFPCAYNHKAIFIMTGLIFLPSALPLTSDLFIERGRNQYAVNLVIRLAIINPYLRFTSESCVIMQGNVQYVARRFDTFIKLKSCGTIYKGKY